LKQPPKSCGREQFGASFAHRLKEMCAAAGGSTEDAVATATRLTVTTIAEAYLRFCREQLRPGPIELIAAGGGVKNMQLMSQLQFCFKDHDAMLLTTEAIGIPAQAKEAVAFALLAWLTWNGLPGNIPAATGANRPVVLGKVSFG